MSWTFAAHSPADSPARPRQAHAAPHSGVVIAVTSAIHGGSRMATNLPEQHNTCRQNSFNGAPISSIRRGPSRRARPPLLDQRVTALARRSTARDGRPDCRSTARDGRPARQSTAPDACFRGNIGSHVSTCHLSSCKHPTKI